MDTTTWGRRAGKRAVRGGLALALAAAMLAGCGGGGGDGEPAAAAPPPAATSPTIDSSGGTVSEVSGATVVVPAGALDTATTIRVAMDSTGAPALPASLVATGNTYVITPHGGDFAQPVEVRIPAPATTLQPNQALKLAKAQPGGEWELLDDSTLTDGVLRARVSSFSHFVPVTVTYLLPIFQAAPLSVSTTLDCGPFGCRAALGPVTATYTVTSNNGQLPANCSSGRLAAQVRDTTGFSNATTGTSIPLSGGAMTATLAPQAGSRYFVLGLHCSGFGISLDSGYGKPVTWRSSPPYPETFVLRQPSQLDVVAGLSAGLDVVLGGAAARLVSGQTYARPTAANRAVVDWQRSDDNGASWRVLARSYQDEANPRPAGPGFDWRYWSVRHGFTATDADQGALIRVQACYTPPDVPAPPCVTGPATRLNVLQQSALPSFAELPRSMLVRTGQTASLSTLANGAPTPSLRWQTRAANAAGDWADVASGIGATTANYTTAALSMADSGTQYRVVATNALGSAESPPVTVSVSDLDVAPTVTTHPGGLRVTVGNDATFATAARGTEALSYQWQFNGVPIPGANSPVLRLSNVTAADAGNYGVLVSNSVGSVRSEAAPLSVSTGVAAAVAPSIVTQPVAVRVGAGNTATFAVGTSGSGPLAFQWLRNGQTIVGATAAFYSLYEAALEDVGSYAVRVSNGAGSVTSSTVDLSVSASPLSASVTLTTQPSPQVQAPGGSVTFAVAASGGGPITYQWSKNGAPLAGATAAVLTLTNLVAEDAASYSVTAGNALGSVTSNAASLTVLGVPAITSQPAAATVVAGSSASFHVTASGSGLRYQWLRNGVAISGAVAASHTTPALAVGDSGALYGVLVYNGAGVVFSQGAVLSVTAAPVATGALAIVTNSLANTLSIYRADASTGVLTEIGTTGTGAYPYAVVITPNGRFAYVSNLMGNSLSSYSVDSAAGTVAMTGLSVNSVNPYGVAMDPLGRFVWAANYSASTVSAYAIDATTGQLTAAGAPLATGSYPNVLVAHPSGNYVYVASETGNNVRAYSVAAGTGQLTLLPGTIADSVYRPTGVAVDPSGQFVYAVGAGSRITAFRVDGGGALSLIGNVATGASPSAVTVHPNGRFVYVTNADGNTVSSYAINPASGTLTEIGSPVVAGGPPSALAIDPTGTRLQVVNLGGNRTSGFGIDASTGALTSMGAPVAAGNTPTSIAMTP